MWQNVSCHYLKNIKHNFYHLNFFLSLFISESFKDPFGDNQAKEQTQWCKNFSSMFTEFEKAASMKRHQPWPSPGQNKWYDDLFFLHVALIHSSYKVTKGLWILVGYMWLKTFTEDRTSSEASLYFHWPIKHNRVLMKTTFSLCAMSNARYHSELNKLVR